MYEIINLFQGGIVMKFGSMVRRGKDDVLINLGSILSKELSSTEVSSHTFARHGSLVTYPNSCMGLIHIILDEIDDVMKHMPKRTRLTVLSFDSTLQLMINRIFLQYVADHIDMMSPIDDDQRNQIMKISHPLDSIWSIKELEFVKGYESYVDRLLNYFVHNELYPAINHLMFRCDYRVQLQIHQEYCCKEVNKGLLNADQLIRNCGFSKSCLCY